MKEMLRYGMILAVICCLASGLLAGVNALTKPYILAQAQAAQDDALREVLPQATEFTPVSQGDAILYYEGHDTAGKIVGYAFKAAGKGYASTIETMVGMDCDGVVTAIKVMSQNETPGLGTQVAEPAFTAQFPGQRATALSGVSAITGATISSRALINSVKEQAQTVWEAIGND